ncbi:MAG: DNA double-strand break repair nuclease NurA [Candidatus Bathyarchaeia archaeon]
MSLHIDADFAEMEKKLRCYVDKGRVAGAAEVKNEPMLAVRPDASKIKPLRRVTSFDGSFVAVDCGTRTLKRANNWGIYLMRASFAEVSGREVKWNFSERMCTVVGDAHLRGSFLQDFRIELESQMALSLLTDNELPHYYVNRDLRSTYLLLDGGGYFGGERKFRVSLYEECEKKGINLLAISKNSPSLHDDKGRDLVAATYALAPQGSWVYHPVRRADKDQCLYGDVSLVKLCAESPHVFRCDVMDYLVNRPVDDLLSPLTSVCEDPRCMGYPVSLWLAHEFSAPSDSMLLFYHDQAEEILKRAGLYDTLKREELCSSFADEVHGVKHAFEREGWFDQL